MPQATWDSATSGPCVGLNVLELGSGSIAASMAGMVFADAGANVIKIEPPAGDSLRLRDPSGFLVWNRGKASEVVDLVGAQGQRYLADLVRHADVVIDGFSPSTSESWNVGAGSLCAINSALVHCSITSFGRVGPYSGIKARDSLVAAKAGLWARGAFAYREGPIMYPVPWASFGAAMQSVAGIIGALLVRQRAGLGQQLDATLFAGLEPVDYFVATIVQLMTKRGQKPATDAREATSASRFGVLLATRDGRFIQTSTILPHQGRALTQVAGIGQVLDDPRFSRLPTFDSAQDAQDWEDLLLEAFRAQDLAYWRPRLEGSPDVAFEIAVTSEEGLSHPQLLHNGDVIAIEDPGVGTVWQVGPIGHFSSTPIRPTRAAPGLGDGSGGFPAGAAYESEEAGALDVPRHPFTGVTIVEFGYFYAMPYALAMMAALGARVIKIEDVDGDPHRTSFGPEVASSKTTAGKESLSLNLRTAAGRAMAQQLVMRADVFVTGFRSGVADKLGLGYAELKTLNPRLVYVHAAGYGTDGPYAHRALYAQAAQTVAGSFGRQVGYWSTPERNQDMSAIELQAIVIPRLAQVIDGDSNASLGLLAAIALAIYQQVRTNQGQFIATSMIATNALAYSDDFCSYSGKPPAAACDEEYWGISPLHRLYPAAEGSYVCVQVYSNDEFSRLLQTLGTPQIANDQRFASATARAANEESLVRILSERFLLNTAQAWETLLVAADVGCCEVNMQGQPVVTSFDTVLRETGLTVAYEHPLFGSMVRAAPPVMFSRTKGRVGPPCMRGEHNRRIARELGYSDSEISQLEEDGVLIPATALDNRVATSF